MLKTTSMSVNKEDDPKLKPKETLVRNISSTVIKSISYGYFDLNWYEKDRLSQYFPVKCRGAKLHKIWRTNTEKLHLVTVSQWLIVYDETKQRRQRFFSVGFGQWGLYLSLSSIACTTCYHNPNHYLSSACGTSWYNNTLLAYQHITIFCKTTSHLPVFVVVLILSWY